MPDRDVISADALSRVGELTLELTADGVPRQPVLVIRAGTEEFLAPIAPDGARPIIVLVREEAADPVPAALARWVDITLTRPGDALTGDALTGHPWPGDAVQTPDPRMAADELVAAVEANPRASVALAGLLRSGAYRDVGAGLLAESAVYSTLQAGAEYAAWLQARRPRPRPAGDDGPRVRSTRRGDTLEVVLTRAARHNALDARLRDELFAALAPARWDPGLTVCIRGEGPTFSSGGDLDEFGSAPDPPGAHLIRLQAALGTVLDELADRTEVRVHGHCHGAGVELPAFSGHVIAAAGTTFRLPEIAMGLIPGAGGTTSLPRRIGVARALWLALSGRAIDTRTALDWGLIDAIG